jgi:succinate-semialdehyde dehydrogenase/glutarate-semialdehyde dehydrogenase
MTILTEVREDMRVHSEEIFGPAAPIFRFNTEEEAIAMANDTPFGLASYFYTRDVGREGSRYGLDDYLDIKYICMGGLDSQ